MHWAYHRLIKDDRYDYLANEATDAIATGTKATNDDEFDSHDCILNIPETMRSMPDGLSFDSVPVADDDPSIIC
jgi:hypothetical protein